MNNQPLVALVTGCSRSEGLGFEVCKQLGEQGITVLLTAQEESDALDLAAKLQVQGLDVYGRELDIAIAESIQAIVDFIEERYGRLDILINNATGVAGNPAPASAADLALAQQVFEVTVFGTWRLIQATLPLIRKSEAARIVNISSGAGSHGDPVYGLTRQSSMDPAYGVAKAALNAVTAKLATELRDTHIKINAVCPGFTATRPSMAALGARPVSDGARGIVWAATLKEDGPSGGFYRDTELQAW